jgi:hypothetical protein
LPPPPPRGEIPKRSSNTKVTAMSKFVFASVALVCALAAPTVTFAETTVPSVHHDAMSPHKAHMSRRERMKIEGLSTNPRDCVRYGCVGNN